MNHACFILLAMLVGSALLALQVSEAQAGPAPPGPPAFNRVRFFPAPEGEQAMVGGRLEGSNVSRTEGFERLAEIKTPPRAGQWSELKFNNNKVYRWLRYIGPPGSFGKIAEIEFYADSRKLSGKGNAYGSVVKFAEHSWQQAFDGKTNTWFESDVPDNQFVGADLKDLATARTPNLEPAPYHPYGTAIPVSAITDGPLDVAIKCPTPGAVIRYTLDGTTPTRTRGYVYCGVISVRPGMTVKAIAYKSGMADSVVTSYNP